MVIGSLSAPSYELPALATATVCPGENEKSLVTRLEQLGRHDFCKNTRLHEKVAISHIVEEVFT